MARTVAPALRALLKNIIDYAGMFPPATLPCADAVTRYQRYRAGPRAWMLRWLVVGTAELDKVPAELDGLLSILSESSNPRAAAIESKRVVGEGMPTYCEVGIDELDAARVTGSFAKIRTGGLTPEAIPRVEQVAEFIRACAERRLAFKATAGLHHPVRSVQPLTYEANAACATTHGFLNVFVASAFAWHGMRDIEPILVETDASTFRFDERAHWRDRSLTIEQIESARAQFAHAFGSCSFEEPVQDLEALGLL